MTSASRVRTRSSRALTYAILIAGALITLGPFALSIFTAFKTPRQFAGDSPLTLPSPATLENFGGLFDSPYVDFGRSLWVTILYVAVVVIGQMLFSILAAFAFARMRFPGRDAVFWVYLSTLMVPQVVTVVPLYLMMAQSGLRDTFWALVLHYLFGSPYAIFLLREHFRSVSQDLLDAARIDGAGTLRVLFQVMVPLSRPIIVTLVIITVVTHWNNFLWPLIITSGGEWQVTTVATANMQSQYNGNWTMVMAATTFTLVPLITLFIIFNKWIVRSITITSFR